MQRGKHMLGKWESVPSKGAAGPGLVQHPSRLGKQSLHHNHNTEQLIGEYARTAHEVHCPNRHACMGGQGTG